MTPPERLPTQALRSSWDADAFEFTTTADLELLDDIVGQTRANEAVRFAVGIAHQGYNLFAFGPEGTGKSSLVMRSLEHRARAQPVPDDWAYVNNFSEPRQPHALRLPPGRAKTLAHDMEQLVGDLLAAIPAAFESEEYRTRKQNLQEEFKETHERSLEDLQTRAAKKNVAVIRTPMGLAVAPMHEGHVVRAEDFQKLKPDEQKKSQQAMDEIQEEVEVILRQLPEWDRERRALVRQLDDEVTAYVVSHLMTELRGRYADLPEVDTYLEQVSRDVIKNAADFLPDENAGQQIAVMQRILPQGFGEHAALRRYFVNVIIDHSAAGDGTEPHTANGGAPVVKEENPTQPNLVGRIDHVSHLGAVVTDFGMIKPGALHKANGGYLVLDGRKLLTQPFSYDALKRALTGEHIRLENPYESYGLASTMTLDPEPIPLSVKVVLLGEARIYYLLNHYDPEFRKLFKVAADFDDRMERNEQNAYLYARLVATITTHEKLRPLDAEAVAQIVDHGSRLAGDAHKLSTHMSSVADLVREADYWAGTSDATVVNRSHVRKAIEAKVYRSDRIRERIQEEIHRGTIVIDSTGTRVGELNGLAVYQLGDFAFGRPSRISCRVHLGRGQVTDIERQVDLGGPTHSKGVLILSSFLNSRYAGDSPLALAASLVFEQSYGEIEGDSASSAELYALLSAIAQVPLKQHLAVTGSIDQNGRVQAIGGVNEKIEGFFDVCQARGLTGDQGVLIPQANVQHLMLREDVVAASDSDLFHVYPIETIDQGLELLTGIPAGERNVDGEFPYATVNRMVVSRLDAAIRRSQDIAAFGQLGPVSDDTDH